MNLINQLSQLKQVWCSWDSSLIGQDVQVAACNELLASGEMI